MRQAPCYVLAVQSVVSKLNVIPDRLCFLVWGRALSPFLPWDDLVTLSFLDIFVFAKTVCGGVLLKGRKEGWILGDGQQSWWTLFLASSSALYDTLDKSLHVKTAFDFFRYSFFLFFSLTITLVSFAHLLSSF